jgi:2-dehydropantoate 2-reductase
MRGRRTEIDHLNGYVVAEGRKVGLKTPFNEAVVRLFQDLGVGFTPDPRHLEPLMGMLPR